jgi:hypothetical protein
VRVPARCGPVHPFLLLPAVADDVSSIYCCRLSPFTFPRCVIADDRFRLLPTPLPAALLFSSAIAAEAKHRRTLSGNNAKAHAAMFACAAISFAMHAVVCASHMAIRLFSSRIVSLSFLILHCHKKCILDPNQLRKSKNVYGSAAVHPATAVRENAFKMLTPIEAFLSTLALAPDIDVTGRILFCVAAIELLFCCHFY